MEGLNPGAEFSERRVRPHPEAMITGRIEKLGLSRRVIVFPLSLLHRFQVEAAT